MWTANFRHLPFIQCSYIKFYMPAAMLTVARGIGALLRCFAHWLARQLKMFRDQFFTWLAAACKYTASRCASSLSSSPIRLHGVAICCFRFFSVKSSILPEPWFAPFLCELRPVNQRIFVRYCFRLRLTFGGIRFYRCHLRVTIECFWHRRRSGKCARINSTGNTSALAGWEYEVETLPPLQIRGVSEFQRRPPRRTTAARRLWFSLFHCDSEFTNKAHSMPCR